MARPDVDVLVVEPVKYGDLTLRPGDRVTLPADDVDTLMLMGLLQAPPSDDDGAVQIDGTTAVDPPFDFVAEVNARAREMADQILAPHVAAATAALTAERDAAQARATAAEAEVTRLTAKTAAMGEAGGGGKAVPRKTAVKTG